MTCANLDFAVDNANMLALTNRRPYRVVTLKPTNPRMGPIPPVKGKPLPRVNIRSGPGEREVFYISKRGNTERRNAPTTNRYLVQQVRATSRGSYWNTVEVCSTQPQAEELAISLASTNKRSYRVAAAGIITRRAHTSL